MPQPLLEVEGLKQHFNISRRAGLRTIRETVRAVDGIDLTLNTQETLGLVGESGCGKTTAGRTILRLMKPTAGSVRFEGVDLAAISGEPLRRLRKDMSIVFQDPMSALNPRMMIGDIVSEPLSAHGMVANRREALERASELLKQVGLQPNFTTRYPHEFSGGQRQRIGIARAIATRPKMIVLDEPISALDISIRAQILNLLEDLQAELGLAYLFIAHDLSVVRHACNRVAVMYLGVLVEVGNSDEVMLSPRHPYTQALIASAPEPKPREHPRKPPLEGDVPTPVAIPSGCRFRTRCPYAQERCSNDIPALREVDSRLVACHFAEALPASIPTTGV
jgi:oligopeptide/dipeptide ABC transporter ATP-binding protein